VRYRQALLLLPALAAAPAIHAETLYVIEQLVVNVNNAPDASGERVATIKSGEAVEVLERQGDQIHVHLPNGTEGWVRKSYLSADEPLQHRLTERTAEVEKLKQDVARLQSDLATARAGSRGGTTGLAQTNTAPPGSQARMNATASVPATKVPSVPPPARKTTTASQSPPADTNTVGGAVDPAAGEPSYFMTPPDAPARPVWHWALGSFVVALGVGYALGWYVLDRRIRRKYGGLRIY
jgi:SH3 domain-containing protein